MCPKRIVALSAPSLALLQRLSVNHMSLFQVVHGPVLVYCFVHTPKQSFGVSIGPTSDFLGPEYVYSKGKFILEIRQKNL